MATVQQVYLFLRHHSLGSLHRQSQLQAALQELVDEQRTQASEGASWGRSESQSSGVEVPDEYQGEVPSVIAALPCLPPDSTLMTLYREVLRHQTHQFETQLGGMDCVVITNTPLEEAHVTVVFLHGLGASPWHFLRMGAVFLHEYLGLQVVKKGKFFDCKAAFIFPFGSIQMQDDEFGAVDGTVYGSYKWWDIFNNESPPSPRTTPPDVTKTTRGGQTPLQMSPSASTGVSTMDETPHGLRLRASPATAGAERSQQASPVATPSLQRPFCWCLKPEGGDPNKRSELSFPQWDSPECLMSEATIQQRGIANSSAQLDNPKGRQRATKAVIKLIEAVKNTYKVKRLVLGGFSQGAMLALDVFFHLPSPPSLLGVMSGAPMCVEQWKKQLADMPLERRRKLKAVPILQSHGNRDWVLPVFVGRWLDRFLKRNGFWTKYMEFDGEHELHDATLETFNDLCYQLALEGSLNIESNEALTQDGSPAASVATPSNQMAGFSRLTQEQPILDTIDDFLYKAGYAVASCVLPVAKLTKR